MLLPNFICPGAQKAATTTLYVILKQHPDIFLPQIKETHFFDNPRNFNRGKEWYSQNFFASAGTAKIIGDITPGYLYLDFIPERIVDVLGKNLKFVCMLRNPVDRAYSQYCMAFYKNMEKLTFEGAIRKEPARIKKNLIFKKKYSYVDRGYYAKQIKNYFNYFARESFHFIKFEDFIRDTAVEVQKLFEFLEVDPFPGINLNIKAHTRENLAQSASKTWLRRFRLKLINRSAAPFPLTPETRRVLVNRYKEDILELEQLINKNFGDWLVDADHP